MSKQWQDKEERDSKSFGARRTPRSGGLWFAKGDSKSSIFFIESKSTKKKSYSITEKVWERLLYQSVMEGRIPTLSIEFGTKQRDIVVLDKGDFITLMNR